MNTMQQEFDAVVQHLYKQGRPAIEHGTCQYRARQGDVTLSCAVGCRIPDDVYVGGMDVALPEYGVGTGLKGLLRRFKEVLPVEISAYQDMFADLQSAHDEAETLMDGSFDMDLLAEELACIADDHGLTFTVPEVTQ